MADTPSIPGAPEQIRYLRSGAVGPAVTLLHLSLLRFDYHVDDAEVVRRAYGFTTRQGVVPSQCDRNLTPSGIVDEETALQLSDFSSLKELKNFVVGLVRHPNGSTATGLGVSVIDCNLRNKREITSGKTDAQGYYRCSYIPSQLEKPKKISADLIVRIVKDNDVLNEPSVDDILFNSPPLSVIEISLIRGEDIVVDEYTTILKRVQHLLETEDVPLADLREDDEKQDISFLARETGFSGSQLIHLVVAFKLRKQFKGVPDFLYALFAKETLLAASATSLSGTRGPIGLQTPLEPLWYDAVLLPTEVITATVKVAVQENLVPASLLGRLKETLAQLEQWRGAAKKYVESNPPEKEIFSTLKAVLKSGLAETVKQIFDNPVFGDLPAFIGNVQKAMERKPRLQPGPEGMSLLLTKIVNKQVSSEKDLVKLTEEEWETELTAFGSSLSAHDLVRYLERRHPTASFAAQSKRSPNFADVGLLLDKLPDFDLSSGNVGLLLKTQTSTSSLEPRLRSIQRVFKLAPTFRQTRLLMEHGLSSAADIHSLGKARFLAEFGSHSAHPFTPAEALKTFQRAESLHIASTLLAGQLISATRFSSVPALSAATPTAKIEAVVKDFPNMKTLFQLGDACACDQCMTVHSPSAYLVDVLTFLGNRWVTDSVNSTQSARKALFARRPDLGDVDLSCANTDTPLPYLDIVCEILESQVAPETGFEVQDALSEGPVPATVLAKLVGQGFAFSQNALVSEPDLAGNVIVRDTQAVVKFTPNGTNSWIGTQLKQTYQNGPELAAMPEYVNIAAYNKLAGSKFAFDLPFDLAHQEISAYFSQFGMSRSRLMELLGSGSADVACEELGITKGESELITQEAPDIQEAFWNVEPSTMRNVDKFVTKAKISYTDLQQMLALRGETWLNVNQMYIHHKDNTCNLDAKEIGNIDNGLLTNNLDKFHRFLRLWKKLSAFGWTIQTLDSAIFHLGNATLNSNFLEVVANCSRMTTRLKMTPTECVELFHPLSLDGEVYVRVFLNLTANGKVEDAFRPANVRKNEQNVVDDPTSVREISSEETYIAVCLGRHETDIQLLISGLETKVLSSKNISSVYALHRFALNLGISVPDLMASLTLTKHKPLADPKSALTFLDDLELIRSSSFSPSDLLFFLNFEGSVDERKLDDSLATENLALLQQAYTKAWNDHLSPFDANTSLTENVAHLLKIASAIGISAVDLSKLQLIIDVKQADFTSPAEFLRSIFGSFGDTSGMILAQQALESAPTADKEAKRLDLIQILDEFIVTYLYKEAKRSALVATVMNMLHADEAVVKELLRAHIGTGADIIETILMDDTLLGPSPLPQELPRPPELLPVKFEVQYDALRLLHVMFPFVKQLDVEASIGWILDHAGDLKWMSLNDLPYKAGVPKIPFEDWKKLVKGVQLIRRYPAVINPATPGKPYTIYKLFELVISNTDITEHLALLAGWDKVTLQELIVLFTDDYKDPQSLLRLEAAISMLRTLNITLATAISVAKPQLSNADVAIMRKALKALYDESSWLPILQNIMNPIRKAKRDALVTFILAENPSLQTSVDLYDYFLIDVEMGFEMSTSRIVQCHSTIQLFVQRCLMGLEPSSIADVEKDSGWLQWKWMAQYRVWEANRKVFLWPENWIEPELRDDKSEIYQEFENTLRQGEMTPQVAENATIQYLERLNDISLLDVMATYYETSKRVSHVFARTKGGDPLVWYYRQFQKERYWTPWEKMDVGITGNHLVAFDRMGRLSLAWLEMLLESDQTQEIKTPDPDSIPAGGQSVPPPFQRWKIQLAVSERDLSGKWTPKRVSLRPVYLGEPGSNAFAVPADFQTQEESMRLHGAWAVRQDKTSQSQQATRTFAIPR